MQRTSLKKPKRTRQIFAIEDETKLKEADVKKYVNVFGAAIGLPGNAEQKATNNG